MRYLAPSQDTKAGTALYEKNRNILDKKTKTSTKGLASSFRGSDSYDLVFHALCQLSYNIHHINLSKTEKGWATDLHFVSWGVRLPRKQKSWGSAPHHASGSQLAQTSSVPTSRKDSAERTACNSHSLQSSCITSEVRTVIV